MADSQSKTSRRLSSRLQMRAPASIKISPAAHWNVAIPLLSPLNGSPTSPPYRTADIKKEDDNNINNNKEKEKPIVYKKWQHPAAPFCYETTPLRPFMLTTVSDS